MNTHLGPVMFAVGGVRPLLWAVVGCLLIQEASSQETLRCAVLEVPSKETFRVRDTLSKAPAQALANDDKLASLKAKRLVYVERLQPILDEPVQIRGEVLGTKGKAAEDFAATLDVEKVGDEEILFNKFDVDLVLPEGRSDYRRCRNPGDLLAFKAGKWLEVASWAEGGRTIMLWQFAEGKGAPGTAEDSGNRVKSYRVEVIFAKVSTDILRKLGTLKEDQKEAAVKSIVEKGTTFRSFNLNCLVGEPFISEFTTGPRARLADGEEEGSYSRLKGKVVSVDGGFKLECELGLPASKEKTPEPITLTTQGEVGGWKLEVVEGREDANIIAFRVVN